MNHVDKAWEEKSRLMAEWSGCEDIAKHYFYLGFVEGDKYREEMIASDRQYLLELLEESND